MVYPPQYGQRKLTYRLHARSSSDQDISRKSRKPLKPCMKHKAKSAANTPPNGPRENISTDFRSLRSAKVVDFDKSKSDSRNSSPGRVPYRMVEVSLNRSCSNYPRIPGSTKSIQRRSRHPGVLSSIKGRPAGPAITRTEVHVVAVPFSWDEENTQGDMNPPTPTMQIVESRDGCFEVIWDDIPTETHIGCSGRRASTSYTISSNSSAAQQRLERVNAKLTDWFVRWNQLSNSYFKPTVVVFPDDDHDASQHDYIVQDDDEALGGFAPPNSQVTSPFSSRLPSKQVSAATTREPSREDFIPDSAVKEAMQQNERHRSWSRQQYLVAPGLYRRPGGRIGASRRMRLPSTRKLSNLEAGDQHFQGHRDSLAVARSQIVPTGKGISPALIAHHDSIALAKKRLNAAHRAREEAERKAGNNDMEPEIDQSWKDNDNDDGSPAPREKVKQSTSEASEKNDLSSPILQASPQMSSQRRIRIAG